MNSLSYLPIAGAVFLAACHVQPSGTLLTTSSMYSIDTVRMAAEGGRDAAAGTTLQEALALYRKKGSDTAHCIELFRNSVLSKPTAKGYYELAGALISSKQFDEGLKALSMAEALGYAPLANVMFRYAYAYANRPVDNDDLPNCGYVVRYMELAIQMGYSHPQQFLQRDLFPDAARKSDYDAVFTNALSGSSVKDPAKPLWDAFEGQFPEVGLPVVIDLSWVQAHKLNASIDYQYEKFIPEMRQSKFSREGGPSYYYVARIHKDHNFVALLYAEADDVDDADQPQQPLCILVTYVRQGKLIDKMPVAGRNLLKEPSMVCSIQPDLKFRIQKFTDIYRDNPDSAGYEHNEIIRREAATPEDFQISANGNFQPIAPPVARR